MAELLYRVGRFSARRAWTVLITWMVVLGLSVTAYFVFGGTLSSQVTIPGTATAKVTDQLAARFPSASGGSGTIVFHTTGGSAFTAGQRTAIGALLKSTGDLGGVATTTDPFVTEQQLEKQIQQVEGGRQQLAGAREKLEQARAARTACRRRSARSSARNRPDSTRRPPSWTCRSNCSTCPRRSAWSPRTTRPPSPRSSSTRRR